MQQNFRLLPVALLLFSAGWLSSLSFLIGLIILVVWNLLNSHEVWKNLKYSPLFWLSVAAILYLLAHFLLLDSGIELVKTNKDLKGHILLWLYPLLGYAIYRSGISPSWILLIAAIGLTIRIVGHIDWLDIQQFTRKRQGFGMSIIAIGLYSAIVVMGLFAFKHKFWFIRRENILWRVLFWWLLILINSYCLVLTLSRGAWVSMTAGLATAFVIWLLNSDIKSMMTRQKIIMLTSFIVLFLIIAITASPKLVKRMGYESKTYAVAMTLDREKIPYSSVGIRAHLFIYGFEKWQEKIWFGWGLGSTTALLDRDERLGSWPHFHNSYLQIATKLGAVGLIFYTAGFILMIVGLRRAHRNGNVSTDMYSFLIAAWVMVLVWSLFDSRLVHVDERFLLMLLSAISFRFVLPDDSEGSRLH